MSVQHASSRFCRALYASRKSGKGFDADVAKKDAELMNMSLELKEAKIKSLEKRLDAESDLDWASQLIRHERDAEGKRADAAEEEVWDG